MNEILQSLFSGFVLGALVGMQPGALFLIMMRETVRGGFRAGCAVSAVPWFTDGPIIAGVFLALERLASQQWLLPTLAVAGSLWLGREGWRTWKRPPASTAELAKGMGRTPGSAFWVGMRTNWLNPFPYMFWTLMAGPKLLAGGVVLGLWHAAGILAGTSAVMILVAWLMTRGWASAFLGSPWLPRGLGVGLMAFSVYLPWRVLTQ